jgi:hypothetical protein
MPVDAAAKTAAEKPRSDSSLRSDSSAVKAAVTKPVSPNPTPVPLKK